MDFLLEKIYELFEVDFWIWLEELGNWFFVFIEKQTHTYTVTHEEEYI